MFDVSAFRRKFPFYNADQGIYLDSASTLQRPKSVVDALISYYSHLNMNVGRGAHKLADINMEILHNCRQKILNYYSAGEAYEVIFTYNATLSLNLLANGLISSLDLPSMVMGSIMEHHSNYLPWMAKCKTYKIDFDTIPLNDEGQLDLTYLQDHLRGNAVLSLTTQSNVNGHQISIPNLMEAVQRSNPIVVFDDTQKGLYEPLNITQYKPDFVVASGHKMGAPFGISMIIGKKEILDDMPPLILGGGMVLRVGKEDFIARNSPGKFEAGTLNMAAVAGLDAAIDFIQTSINDEAKQYLKQLSEYAFKKLSLIDELKWIPGTKPTSRIFSFNINNIHPHDVSTLLSKHNIMIRSGHLCAIPFLENLNLKACNRISLCYYNTFDEIDKVIAAIKECITLFK